MAGRAGRRTERTANGEKRAIRERGDAASSRGNGDATGAFVF